MNAAAHIDYENAINVEEEQLVLGAILTNNDAAAITRSMLKPEYFAERLHRDIYAVAVRLIDAGDLASPITLRAHFEPGVMVGEITLSQYLARLVSQSPGVFNAKAYAKGVLQAWQRRQLVDLALEMAERARLASVDASPETLAGELGERIIDIVNSGVDAKKSRQYGDILLSAMQAAQDRRNDDRGLIRWFLPELDDVIGPVRPGNLTGFMSDSGGGKTSLSAMQCRFAAEAGIPTGFFSIEITEEEAAMQMAAQRIGVSMGEIDAFDLLRPKQDALMTERETGQSLPLVIESFDRADLAEIGSRVAMLKKRMGLKFVMIDHAKLIELPGRGGDNFAERVNGLYRGLKAIAKNTGVGIVVLIQRNNDWKGRKNPRPIPSDAYGGGGVKQSLDAFFSLYRPETLWAEKMESEASADERARLAALIEQTRGYAWVINHKQRRGVPFMQKRIRFEASFTRFSSDRVVSSEIEQELPF
ncbi:DnaB-like helicase C-terminal domain-containing protein [Aureimonas glaciei]|uniref:DNA 5'-3' helicase n=1 Tax=Aureimonas glaciei TaxID=1776957 RepID=A0A916YG83_9HYPH|nr:DnaB-like helicase C-terminal domain-containing protein [Aureimonas glaciei]GGD43274.1 replicative DNA helicase [Aureimonas glaciei]